MYNISQSYSFITESIQSNLLADIIENILSILQLLLDLAVVRFNQVR